MTSVGRLREHGLVWADEAYRLAIAARWPSTSIQNTSAGCSL